MSYETAVARMYTLGHELAHMPSQKFDLAHMRVLLGALNHPERRFPSVLIAGTNGKGSTAATLASILRVSGVKTGLYTSPHLVRINERIRIDSAEIGDDDFALLHDVVERTAERLVEEGDLPWHPSFFEMLTAIAFECFAQNKVEIAVLEVGMGGRLDATNVVEPRVSVITDISLDHQKFLGNTVTEIAHEKAGIIRRDGVVVTLPQQPQANDVIGNAILDLNARAVSAVPYVPAVSPGSVPYLMPNIEKPLTPEDVEDKEKSKVTPGGLISRYPLHVMGTQILVETPLVGRHQLRNLALSIAAAEELGRQGFPILPKTIERGIRETRWPGRFQVIPPGSTNPSTSSMWPTTPQEHGRCGQPCPLATMAGRSRLSLAPCATRPLARWPRFSFRWRSGSSSRERITRGPRRPPKFGKLRSVLPTTSRIQAMWPLRSTGRIV